MAEQCLKQLEIDVKKEEQYSATQLEITQMLAGLQIRRCKSILLMDNEYRREQSWPNLSTGLKIQNQLRFECHLPRTFELVIVHSTFHQMNNIPIIQLSNFHCFDCKFVI